MNVLEKLRSGHVRRWHTVAVTREQTVADHMHRVVLLTEEILRLLGYFNWDNTLTRNAMRWASIHDRSEYELGDIPTPAKRLIRQGVNGTDPFLQAELTLEGDDREYLTISQRVGPNGECPLAGYVVKVADTLEALNYLGIFGTGSHANDVWLDVAQRARAEIEMLTKVDRSTHEQKMELLKLMDRLKEGEQFARKPLNYTKQEETQDLLNFIDGVFQEGGMPE